MTISCREVHRYLGDSARRDAVRRTVADTIAATSAQGGARVVLAHSVGSVVVYEALWARPASRSTLITMGFPLALPDVVFDQLEPVSANGLLCRSVDDLTCRWPGRDHDPAPGTLDSAPP